MTCERKQVVRRMHRLHHLPTSALRRVPSHLAQPRRGFVGGAFETEFESRAKVGASALMHFSQLETLPNEAGHAQEEAQSLVRSILSEYARKVASTRASTSPVQSRSKGGSLSGNTRSAQAGPGSRSRAQGTRSASDEGSGDAAGGGQASASCANRRRGPAGCRHSSQQRPPRMPRPRRRLRPRPS